MIVENYTLAVSMLLCFLPELSCCILSALLVVVHNFIYLGVQNFINIVLLICTIWFLPVLIAHVILKSTMCMVLDHILAV